MANYGNIYRAEFRNTRGQDYRLDIYKRGYSLTAKTIKTLAGCVLEIQGAQGDVTAPIVKTQLRFTLVDAWDIVPSSAGEKWGGWDEFYTPDATLYKVKLSSLEGNTATAIWTGYVTPDSWQEELGYRKAITITARDNIGHLKDFQFDLTPNSDGLVKISDIITGAMGVIDFAMDYTIARSGLGPTSLQNVIADGVYLHDAYINSALLKGMNWYDVLERTLEAAGMCMRYVGGNDYEITYLRNMPKMGSPYASPGYQTLEFYGGNLSFDPAVKQIVEDVDYKMQKEVPLEILSGIQYGASSTYRCKVEGNTLPGGGTVSVPEHDAPADTVSSAGSSAWGAGFDLFDASQRLPDDFLKRAEGEDGWRQYAMIPCNRATDNTPGTAFGFHSRTSAVKITVNFTPHPLSIKSTGSAAGKMTDPHYSLSEIIYVVQYSNEDHTVTRYWNGAGWVQNEYKLTREYDAQNDYGTALDIELAECEDIASGIISVTFYNIKYKCWSSTGTGVYARVQSILVGLASTRAVDSDRVKTINNAAYNVQVDRRPLFGALSRNVGFTCPENYLAALFYYPNNGSTPDQYPYLVRFEGQSAGSEVPLPVITHQQILCYRHGAARVLSGRCAPIDKAAWELNSVFRYKGTDYYLQGGTLDLFSGIMESAVLHEYVLFDDLWTQTPSYSGETSYNTNTPGTGYSGGNSGGGGGGSVTEADPVFTASPAHGITAEDIENWNGKSKLPTVSSSDNGKVLKVVSGAWAKDSLAAVASSGSYNDLSNKPAVPTYYTGTGAPASSLGSDGDIYLQITS